MLCPYCTKFYDATAVLFLDAETNFLMQFVGIANQWQFSCLLSSFVQQNVILRSNTWNVKVNIEDENVNPANIKLGAIFFAYSYDDVCSF